MALPHAESNREARLVEANLSLRRELESVRAEHARLQEQAATAEAERDEARAALEVKAEALAHMSHELRTPMNGILGMTRLTLQSELSEKQREHLEVVNSSANALLTLINDILDLSKLDAGRLVLESIPFDLRDTVENSIKSLTTLIDDKGIPCRVEIDEAVPPIVIGDPGRLRQVLLNLVSNAVKFTFDGEVAVFIEPEDVTGDRIDLHFRISDDGIGIPADRIDSIFEPYLQASDSTAREYGGTGLGLAICRDLVDLMGGRIWAESREGEGSTFHFVASFGAAATADEEMLAAIDDLSNVAVYVLASETAGSALAEQLDPAGIKPSLFDAEAAVLTAVEEGAPDVVLIDLDNHSLDLVRTIGDGVATVVVTSSGQRGDAARCREMGVAAYLTRPLGPLDLRDTIRAVLNRRDSTLITRHWLREHRPRVRVLAADDSASNRLIITQMLELQEHDVVTVANGREAINTFNPEQFDVILLDMDMPEMGGIEATQALRAEGVVVPIIALSGHTSAEQVRKCMEAGMNGHLGKPFEFTELIDTVENAAKAA